MQNVLSRINRLELVILSKQGFNYLLTPSLSISLSCCFWFSNPPMSPRQPRQTQSLDESSTMSGPAHNWWAEGILP